SESAASTAPAQTVAPSSADRPGNGKVAHSAPEHAGSSPAATDPPPHSDTSAVFAARRGRYADWEEDNDSPQPAADLPQTPPHPPAMPEAADVDTPIEDVPRLAKPAFSGPTLRGTL